MITGWCPSCTCGWQKPLDAFDVTPPDPDCRNPKCQCHAGFWQSVDADTARLYESEIREVYGGR